ncbi:class IV adenylate cyclase [bacterium]|nr:class IV adenylate cyclase [bacterium]
MLEVELKAWADLEAARRRLEALGKKPEGPAPSVKEDLYFCGPGVDPRTVDPKRDRVVRIRREDGEALATAKRKTIEDGVETSEEIELEVSSADALQRLLDYMGYRPFVSKRKETRAYVWADGIHVELNRIAGLGDFVEIEALLPESTDAGEVSRKKDELKAILASLGVDASRVEPRLYVELLRERGVGLEPLAPA